MERLGNKWASIIQVVLVCSAIGYCQSQPIEAEGSDPTTDKDFFCEVLKGRVRRIPYKYFVIGQPVNLRVRLTNHMNRDVEIRDCAQHYPFYSFEVIDPSGKKLELNKKLSTSMAEINPQSRTIKTGRFYDVEINLSDWYDFSQTGFYTVKASWCVFAKRAPYKRESDTVAINIIKPEQANIAGLIYSATFVTKDGRTERAALCKLVEIGDKAVPLLLEWLRTLESNSDSNRFRSFPRGVVDVLSRIGSKEARDYIVSCKRIESKIHRDMLLRRIDIWQGENKYEKLIEVFEDGPKYDKKWAIFKLGVLGDKRAIAYLENIASDNKALGIRETAKDVLAHLNDPNIPLRYIDHLPSQKVELIPKADTYRLGEPIAIQCKLVAGEYGSRTLVEFSKPAWHFLPWGFNYRDINKSKPFFVRIERKEVINRQRPERIKPRERYRKLVPAIEILPSEVNLINTVKTDRISYNGYIDVDELGGKSTFKLKPKENQLFVLKDIRKAYKINESGEYRISVLSYEGFLISNEIKFNILPKE